MLGNIMTEKIRLGARLRAARKAAGFKTAKIFLKKHRVPASTYSQHESGSRIPDDESLKFYCNVFDVNFEWLKNGTGSPFSRTSQFKKNVIDDELLDIHIIKQHPKKQIEINLNLLNMIIFELFNINNLSTSKKQIAQMAQDAAQIYKQFIQSSNNAPKPKLIRSIIESYKNK